MTRVYDGDTVLARANDLVIKVRLVGIDAPEVSHGKRKPGQPYGRKAQKFLASLVLNKTVEIRAYGLDRYNRVLGVLVLNGRDINLEMIKAGLAEVYRGRPSRGFNATPYREAEEHAKKTRTARNRSVR
ncbi:MAG: thermonuclease family protein [Deltaproteobacteria bacterium]|nr:thermonuclease family protein [Deltaproteobacteria bacterium]MBW2007757.1 thermonuclease family protein [Deltaproteobacteria bacterium]MBW2347166.1 thermonuclease family protein [Deltaproteobacteria bacterium]